MDINQILSDAGYWTIHNGIKIIVVLILTLVLIKVVQLLLNRISLGFTKRKEEDEYTERADKLNSVVRHLLNFIIIIVAIVIILKIAGVNVNGIIQWVVTKGLKIFLILVGVLVAIKAIQIFSGRFSDTLSKQKKVDAEYLKRAETLSSVIQHLLDVIVLLVAIMMILNEIGVEIGPILAAAGIVGLAVGFGAQSLVKDVINGFFLLLQDQIRVGDVVQVGDHGGLVESINLKNTALRDLAGNVHYIPNGNIDIVTNMTKGFSRYVFEIGVAYREDVDEVINVIKLVDEDLRNDPEFGVDILEPIEVLGLDKFADSAIIIKARTTTKPIKQWRVAREFNRRLKKAFDEQNIEIPFPHVTLYMGQDKAGMAPPVHIVNDNPDFKNM